MSADLQEEIPAGIIRDDLTQFFRSDPVIAGRLVDPDRVLPIGRDNDSICFFRKNPALIHTIYLAIIDDLHIKRETLNRYLKILQDAKILYRCNRFDLKSRRSLAGEQKYYLADCAFYFAMNTDNRINYGPVLENIVYTYARSQNYAVSIGRIGKLECDFILRDEQMQYAYVQVAMTIMNSRETEEREYRPLEQIADNYPKFVMTRSDMIQKRNGIRHVNLPEFIQTQGSFT